MRNEVPIHEVAVPVLRSLAMAGVAVETLVWSMKETNKQIDSVGIAIRSCLADIAFRCPLIECVSLPSQVASFSATLGAETELVGG